MHRLFAPFLAIAVLLAVLAPVSGHAADADNKGIKLDFDAAVLQRMSVFVSAFAEVDPQGRWHQIDDASQADAKCLINFGVLHNWMHNASAFAVDGGQASIDAAVVAATIEEYTGLKFDSHAAVPESGISFADGRYAIAADTPKEGPQAVVVNVFATPNNELLMVGHVADKQAPDGAHVEDNLQVRVAHHTWQGKNFWKLLTWAWTGKPEAKPATEPAPAPQSESQSVPEAKPEPQSEPVTAPLAVPEVQPAAESQSAAEPATPPVVKPAEQTVEQPVEQPSEQTAPESAPATPTETENAPTVAPETQPEPEPTPETQPASEAVPETQPTPEAVPAPQPDVEPVAETVIPFTASTEPDFSEVLAVAVPMGWNHRNAEGMLELTPEAQDAWLVVEAARLGARDPQKALKIFSGGAVLTPYGTSGASYIFTSEGRSGHREHMIVVDVDANLICRLTWQASEVHKEAITAILHGLRVNGRAVAG